MYIILFILKVVSLSICNILFFNYPNLSLELPKLAKHDRLLMERITIKDNQSERCIRENKNKFFLN